MDMKNFSANMLTALLLAGLALQVSAQQQVAKEQIKGLDEQVQDIKKDVLAISTDLQQLEEKLLYPSNTQVSFFVSLVPGTALRLDAVKVKVDGKDVAHHIYTFKELDALRSGGVQRIHTGNVRSGEHALEITVIGKLNGSDFQQVATSKFNKAVEPKLVEMLIGAPGQAIQFKD